MICTIHQPQYLPWLGLLSKIDAADLFIVYDDTQYKHDEWQNRNRIKTANGVQWLTVPVHHSQNRLIREVEIDNSKPWARKHAHALSAAYGRAPHSRSCAAGLAALYAKEWTRLADLNVAVMKQLCDWLGIRTPMVLSSELACGGKATDALVAMCRKAGADSYLSGPGGRDYLETAKFKPAGLKLLFHDYIHPVYPQQFGEFVPFLSAIDLLMNCGPESLAILRSGRTITTHPDPEP